MDRCRQGQRTRQKRGGKVVPVLAPKKKMREPDSTAFVALTRVLKQIGWSIIFMPRALRSYLPPLFALLAFVLATPTAHGQIRDGGIDPWNLGKGDWIYFMSAATNKLGGNMSTHRNRQRLADTVQRPPRQRTPKVLPCAPVVRNRKHEGSDFPKHSLLI